MSLCAPECRSRRRPMSSTAIGRWARRAAARSSRRSRRSATRSIARQARLRGRSTRLVGMVVPDITNVFFASLVHRRRSARRARRLRSPLASSSEDPADERRRVEALIARRIDGLIVVPASDDSMASLKTATTGRGCRRPCCSTAARTRRLRHCARRLRGGRLRRRAPSDRPWAPRHRRSCPFRALSEHRPAHRRLPAAPFAKPVSRAASASSAADTISRACEARSRSNSIAPTGRRRFSPSPTSARWPRSRPRAVSASIFPATSRSSASMISTGCSR